MASLPAFDGWADQYFCYDETKDYVLPNNRHATQYYHDHAVGITSENAYNGESCRQFCWCCCLSFSAMQCSCCSSTHAAKHGIKQQCWGLLIAGA